MCCKVPKHISISYILYYTILYYTILYYTILYYTLRVWNAILVKMRQATGQDRDSYCVLMVILLSFESIGCTCNDGCIDASERFFLNLLYMWDAFKLIFHGDALDASSLSTRTRVGMHIDVLYLWAREPRGACATRPRPRHSESKCKVQVYQGRLTYTCTVQYGT